jgi:hypothetical protein
MTQVYKNKKASNLIELSESTDSIVYAISSYELDSDLHQKSNGEAHTVGYLNDRDCEIYEYWGSTWRVHTVKFISVKEISRRD